MKFAKTIKIFLIDGDPNGRISCELSNWSGKAYKIPRINIKDCTDRGDLSSTGVYLLFGKDEEGKDLVYIGEAESIFKRLNQQITLKDFWNETIVFISKDENLNKAHVKYLESRLYEICKIAKRYKIDNSSVPAQSSISEPDRAEMEEFIEYVKLLVNTLGHKIFEEKRPKQGTFHIKVVRGANGTGEPTTDGFVVLKGSIVANTVKSMSSSLVTCRNKLIQEKILIEKNGLLEFADDYIFSSPSMAASIILGRNANGLIEWKNKQKQTLKAFETNEKPTKKLQN